MTLPVQKKNGAGAPPGDETGCRFDCPACNMADGKARSRLKDSQHLKTGLIVFVFPLACFFAGIIGAGYGYRYFYREGPGNAVLFGAGMAAMGCAFALVAFLYRRRSSPPL
jgi:hypothetical protein